MPGFIALLKGIMTKQRYQYATVFVDHFSNYTYVHFHAQNTAQEVVAGKHAFEAHMQGHGVRAMHYHSNNGYFGENLFMQDLQEEMQTITFCSVNGHHQNGRAEKKIRDLREQARAMLLHAHARWQSAITNNLWPYAVQTAMELHGGQKGWLLPNHKDVRQRCGCQPATLPHLWMPDLYPGLWPCSGTVDWTLGIESESRHLLGPVAQRETEQCVPVFRMNT